ncbi:branched-chain amino acid aminotransferase [Curtobacterium flaccumfaciens]|nr:branched-chain amino acid aminotransferase [Curtobacterium flaccumfaciens]
MSTDTAFGLEFASTPSADRRAAAEREQILADPGFGKHFTDHMATVEWTLDDGWHSASIHPYGPLSLDPSASVLHYAQEIFEGLKAYRARRRLGLVVPAGRQREALPAVRPTPGAPELPVEAFVESIRQLVQTDVDWVPSSPETSLYLRPFMIATESFLGVRAAQAVAYHCIASPRRGVLHLRPEAGVDLAVDAVRARGKGGTGAAKTGGNYASSLLPQQEAYEHGCQQVMFLDSVEGKYLEELGGMNVVLVKSDGTLVTPDSESILEGITRDSILQLAEDRGLTVEKRRVTLDEWRDGVADGSITEAFACGTAAVVTPIAELRGEGFAIGSPTVGAGELTMALRDELTDIQYGRRPDPHGWMTKLTDAS